MALRYRLPTPTVLLTFAALFTAACGSGGGTGTGPDPDPDPDDRVILADPSFSQVIQEIFVRKGCTASNCHGAAQEAGMDLRAGSSYDELVGVPATSEDFDRVVPGNPNDSYLVIKLEGRQSVGDRMPLDGTPLDNIDLTNIRNWITQGAENN